MRGYGWAAGSSLAPPLPRFITTRNSATFFKIGLGRSPRLELDPGPEAWTVAWRGHIKISRGNAEKCARHVPRRFGLAAPGFPIPLPSSPGNRGRLRDPLRLQLFGSRCRPAQPLVVLTLGDFPRLS
jgi:hypothetical protein